VKNLNQGEIFMKLSMVILTVLLCVLVNGCQENMQKNMKNNNIDSLLVKSYNDIAMQNAIISQHTLFPYHFITNGAELNELGRRDLAGLASHFMKNPGHLNIRRGSITTDLYEARINIVQERLLEAGVNRQRISISDGMPGGSGITSERMLIILQQGPQSNSTGP
jgi:hypothetical protein